MSPFWGLFGSACSVMLVRMPCFDPKAAAEGLLGGWVKRSFIRSFFWSIFGIAVGVGSDAWKVKPFYLEEPSVIHVFLSGFYWRLQSFIMLLLFVTPSHHRYFLLPPPPQEPPERGPPGGYPQQRTVPCLVAATAVSATGITGLRLGRKKGKVVKNMLVDKYRYDTSF